MKVDDLVRKFGSEADAARALGVTRSAVSVWRKRGIPKGRQALVQIMTRGRLRATLDDGLALTTNGTSEE